MWVPGPEQRRGQVSHIPNIITVWLFFVIHLIHMFRYVLPVHIHPLWIRRVITWKLINLMAHIYNGSRLCPGLRLRSSGYCFGDLSLRTPHDTLNIRLLLLRTYHYAPTRYFRYIHHYKYDIRPVSISFSHPSVSWVIYYRSYSDNVYSVYPISMISQLLGSTGVQYRENNITSLPVQRFKNTGVQEHMSSGIPDVW